MVLSVVFEDWTTTPGSPGYLVRIVNDKDYDIHFNYDSQIMILHTPGISQKEIIPMSRIYSILEDNE